MKLLVSNYRFWLGLVGFFLLAVGAAPAPAQVLDFEGIGDLVEVGEFYNGVGGPDYDISFPNSNTIVDGSLFTPPFTPPSGVAIVANFDNESILVNKPTGFTDGVSLFYADFLGATVSIYDGLDGTGNLLASAVLPVNSLDIADINFDFALIPFAGTAQSLLIIGEAGAVGIDDLTLGARAVVPEPGSIALLFGLGATGIGLLMRRR